MFVKEELISKNIAELAEIARSLNLNIEEIPSQEEAINAILQAQDNATSETTKRTRKRVIKKDTTDHVYSVTGSEGENLDTKAAKRKAKAKSKETLSTAAANPFPKHRGRKSKAELEYLAKIAEQGAANEQTIPFEEEQPVEEQPVEALQLLQDAVEQSAPEQSETEQPVVDEAPVEQPEAEQPATDETPAEQPAVEPEEAEQPAGEQAEAEQGDASEAAEPAEENAEAAIPEEAFAVAEEQTPEDKENLIAQLQAKMNAQNDGQQAEETESAPEEETESVWEGDPGDGTDFIIIEDLPIEDASATPTVDIFDNPVNQKFVEAYPKNHDNGNQQKETYDFSNIVKAIGLMEIMPENYGFLRSSDYNYLSSPDDVFVPMQVIRRYGLKTGDVVECTVCPPDNGDKYFTISQLTKINGRPPQVIRDRVPFEHLTPLFPDQKFNLCGNPATTNLSTRIVDLFSPIGKGQRALIVAQPKTGKTILMKDIANAIAASHPEAYLMMLLIDERPEEVTDMARTVNAEVIASTFDEPAERHVKIAGLVLEKAKRMVECGHDVVIFLDSITRLARAYNTVAPASGKVLTGGVDANALQKPKRFFGAARNIEGGGSLTIIATALIDTGSKMDEVIFEEFKGTGNMELQLDRALANKRMFPAVNLIASSTRRDDLLHDKAILDKMWILRKFISDMNPIEAMNELRERIKTTHSNEEFLLSMNS